jgi:hypothetical protein
MKKRIALLVSVIGTASALAADVPDSYASARAMWEHVKDDAKYQTYAEEFMQFNNHFHLDEKGGCYELSPAPVSLMLVITHEANDKYAVVERVLSDVDNAKAHCFRKSYSRIKTKVPPFLPFVLQMQMD